MRWRFGSPAPETCDAPAPEQIRRQLARILETSDFARYPRSSALLSYVIEESLAGRGESVKEATIGVEVFGRDPGYDCKSDSVVRTQARRVREKLSQFYASPNSEDVVHIEIPKGAYLPVFRRIEVPVSEHAPNTHRTLKISALLSAVAIVAVAGPFLIRPRNRAAKQLPSIEVRPFADLDRQHRSPELASGLTEDLERELARARGLRVVESPAWIGSAGRQDHPPDAVKLKSDALLTGEVARSDGQIEIHAALVRSWDHTILWTDHFRSPAIGDAEVRIENGVASALGVRLASHAAAHAENPKAHDLFFAGRALWATRDPLKTRQAIALYQQALQIDPDYAMAYMGIADAYALMAAHGQIDSAEAVERGSAAARRALELDPSLAEAHAALGLLYLSQWKWKAGDAEYQRAIELNPSYDRAYLRAGILRFEMGDFTAAERLMLEAERLNPYAMSLPLVRAELYYYWRRFDQAEELIAEVRKAEPSNATALQLLARDYFEQHQFKRAVEAARDAVALEPDTLVYKSELASFLLRAGDRAESKLLQQQILNNHGPRALDELSLALMYARMQNKEATIQMLQRALARQVGDLPSTRWDPAFDFVRDDPRYRAIIQKVFPGA